MLINNGNFVELWKTVVKYFPTKNLLNISGSSEISQKKIKTFCINFHNVHSVLERNTLIIYCSVNKNIKTNKIMFK